MGDSWHQEIHLLQDRLKLFSVHRRLCRECCPDFPRLGLGEDRIRFNGFIIIRNPIDDRFAVAPECLRRHVIIFLFRHFGMVERGYIFFRFAQDKSYPVRKLLKYR